MDRFKNILVVAPNDPNATAELLKTALALAERNEAHLTLLGVVDSIPERRRYLARRRPRVDLAPELGRMRLEELRDATPSTSVEVHHEVAHGLGHLEAIGAVLRNGHDLVVTSPGRQPGSGVLGGSGTTTQLLCECPVPVWVHAAPSPSSARSVAVAVGPVDGDERAHSLHVKLLEMGSSLAAMMDAELHIVHGWRLDGEKMLRSQRLAYTPDEVDAMAAEAYAHATNGLERLLGEVDAIGDDAVVHLRKGNARDVVANAVAELNPGILLMGTVARAGAQGMIVGNTAERVIASLDRSIIVVKPNGFVSPVAQRYLEAMRRSA